MKFKSAIITQASGSIGGVTVAHNVGGMYMRARSVPTNPNTTPQQDARNAFGTLAAYWRETLTTAQRAAWAAYAATTPVINKLGDSILLSGQQMFIRNNTARTRAGEALVAPGPVGGGGTMLTTPTVVTIGASTQLSSIGYDNSDDWANLAGGFLIIQQSRQLAETINFFKGPFRFAGIVTGDPTPPTSPAAVASPFGETYTAGMKVFFRILAATADGRISDAKIINGLAS